MLGKCVVLQIKPKSALIKINECNFSVIGVSINRLMR